MVSIVDIRKSLPDMDEEESQDDGITVSDIMTYDPMTIQSNQSMKDAAKLFLDNEFHAVPVLQGDDLVGIISTTDVIQFLMDELES